MIMMYLRYRTAVGTVRYPGTSLYLGNFVRACMRAASVRWGVTQKTIGAALRYQTLRSLTATEIGAGTVLAWAPGRVVVLPRQRSLLQSPQRGPEGSETSHSRIAPVSSERGCARADLGGCLPPYCEGGKNPYHTRLYKA